MSPDRVTSRYPSRRAALMPELHFPRTIEETGLRWELGGSQNAALILAKELIDAQNPNPEKDITYYPIRIRRLDDLVESMLRKQRFNGRVGEHRVLVVPPNPKVFSDNSKNIPAEMMRAFIGFIALSSTGRGDIGFFSYHVTLALNCIREDYGSTSIPDFRIRVKPLSSRSIEAMVMDSQLSWAENLREGLRGVCSAGLPSLGRRR